MIASLSRITFGTIAVLFASSAAHAWHFDYRFVERVGNADFPIVNGSTYNASPGAPVRLRVQFGIFDDINGALPAGGFISWTNGTITDSVSAHNTRTPGRLPPFNFSAGGNGTPPVPAGEPFQMISQINADFVLQSPVWLNDASGVPLPMPQPQVRGLNAFVSVFEFTTTPGATNYTITVGGDLTAASSWNQTNSMLPNNNGTPLNPADDIPGFGESQPVALPPQSFLLPPLSLTIQVPAPATAVPVAALASVALGSRRRRCSKASR